MSEPSTHFGISPIAVVRAADAMLRSLGGDEISLLFAAVAMPDDPSAQLGLVDPGVAEVKLFPVVVKQLPTENSGPRRRIEFLIPGSAIAAELVARNVASAEALFDSLLGVGYCGDVLRIEGVTTEYFAGTAYLYRVVAVE